ALGSPRCLLSLRSCDWRPKCCVFVCPRGSPRRARSEKSGELVTKPTIASLVGLALLLFFHVGASEAAPSAAAPLETNPDQALQAYAKLPLAFVENQGQTDARVRYVAEGSQYAFYL